jgi:hypothetical protein
VNATDERVLQHRFEKLAGPDDADWGDVRGRLRRRRRRTLALAAALAAGLVAAGFAVGGPVVGLFDVHGKRIPLDSFSPRDREALTTFLCPHLELRTPPGRAPQALCLDGRPTIEEIANDGVEVHWRVRYPWGLTCLASGPVGGYHDPNFGDHKIGGLECSASSSKKLVPTPEHPITVEVAAGASRADPEMRVLWVRGLAGEGVEKVQLVAENGARLPITVRGHAYSLKHVPHGRWTAIVALDGSGREVYRESLPGGTQPHAVGPPKAPPPLHPRRARPVGEPVQHASTRVASVDAYRNGVAVLRFASPPGEAYRRLAGEGRHEIDVECAKVAYGAGRWESLGGSGNASVARRMVARIEGYVRGRAVSPPFDYCEVGGIYGRRWTTPAGAHELVEVPFTALGRRYLDERATARDLAYFVRGTKMQRLRRSIHRGEAAPSAAGIARLFGERVVPLASPDGSAPAGKVGVWTDGRIIVASELAPGGRRLYVTVRGVRIGATNIRDLAFVF